MRLVYNFRNNLHTFFVDSTYTYFDHILINILIMLNDNVKIFINFSYLYSKIQVRFLSIFLL